MGFLDLFRRRAAEPAVVPARAPEWPSAPAVQRVVAAPSLITDPDGFPGKLVSHSDPSRLRPPGHLVSPAAPSGVVHGLATAATPVQRAHADLPEPAQPWWWPRKSVQRSPAPAASSTLVPHVAAPVPTVRARPIVSGAMVSAPRPIDVPVQRLAAVTPMQPESDPVDTHAETAEYTQPALGDRLPTPTDPHTAASSPSPVQRTVDSPGPTVPKLVPPRIGLGAPLSDDATAPAPSHPVQRAVDPSTTAPVPSEPIQRTVDAPTTAQVPIPLIQRVLDTTTAAPKASHQVQRAVDTPTTTTTPSHPIQRTLDTPATAPAPIHPVQHALDAPTTPTVPTIGAVAESFSTSPSGSAASTARTDAVSPLPIQRAFATRESVPPLATVGAAMQNTHAVTAADVPTAAPATIPTTVQRIDDDAPVPDGPTAPTVGATSENTPSPPSLIDARTEFTRVVQRALDARSDPLGGNSTPSPAANPARWAVAPQSGGAPTLTLVLPRASLAVQRIDREIGSIAQRAEPYETAPPTAGPTAPTVGHAHASATSTTQSPAAVQRAWVPEALAVSSDQAGSGFDGVGPPRVLQSSERPVRRVPDTAVTHSHIEETPHVDGVATAPTLGISRTIAPTQSPAASETDSSVQRVEAGVAPALPHVGSGARAAVQRVAPAPVRGLPAPNAPVAVGLTTHSRAESAGSRHFSPPLCTQAHVAVQREAAVVRGLPTPNAPVAVGLTTHSRAESVGSRHFSPGVWTQAHVAVQREATVEPVAEPADSTVPANTVAPETNTPTATVVPTAAQPAPPPAAPPAQDVDALVRKLYDPIARKLKAELRLDRERAGYGLDLRH